MASDILYTGRGLAAKLPETGNAMQGLANFIAKAEEIKFNVFQKNKDAFMKMTDVDPVMFLTTANQEAQAKLLDDFNKEAAQIYKNSGGFPSMEEMQQIQAKKNYLVSEQQKMQADMEQVLLEKEVIEKDNGVNYDPQEWYQKKYQPYIETGKWDKTPMVKRAKPIEAVFRGKVTGAGAYEEPDPDNPTRLRQTSASKKDVAVRIADSIFADESVKRHALEEWRALPDSEKEQYLNDANGDGLISDEERQQGDVLVKSLDNPIIKSYVDKHWANLVDVKFTNKQRPPSTTTPSGFNVKIDVGAGNNKNDTFDVRDNVTAYGTTFGKLMNLGRVSFTSDPQTIDEYVDLEKGTSVPLGAATRIEVVSYSPDKDLIVAKVVDDVRGKVRSGKIIGLSGAKYNDLLRSKPFYIDRESLLKQYGGQKTEQTKGLLD